MDNMTDMVNFYCAMAYPGSPLYLQAKREGWKKAKHMRGTVNTLLLYSTPSIKMELCLPKGCWF